MQSATGTQVGFFFGAYPLSATHIMIFPTAPASPWGFGLFLSPSYSSVCKVTPCLTEVYGEGRADLVEIAKADLVANI